jgi:hypothetical protein
MKQFKGIALFICFIIQGSIMNAEMDKRIHHEYHDFREIDKRAMMIPENKTMSVTSLANYIKTFTKSDLEFIRALYVWFASPTGMNYDFECAFDKKPRPNQTAAYALKTKQGVCEAYSNIMAEACRLVNIPAFTVLGEVRNLTRPDLSPEKLHVWVIAKVNGKYGLIDPTFGSGFGLTNEDTTNIEFIKGVNNSYFFYHPYDDVNLRFAQDPLHDLRIVKEYDIKRTTFPSSLSQAIDKYPGLRKHLDNVIDRSFCFYKYNNRIMEEYEAIESDPDKRTSYFFKKMRGAGYQYYVGKKSSIVMYFTGGLLHISREEKGKSKKLLTIDYKKYDEYDFLKKQLCFFIDSPEVDASFSSK